MANDVTTMLKTLNGASTCNHKLLLMVIKWAFTPNVYSENYHATNFVENRFIPLLIHLGNIHKYATQ